MPGRSKLENTHFWLLGKHCRTQSLCSLHPFFFYKFLYILFDMTKFIFLHFVLYISNSRRSELKNTHFLLVGKHCRTKSLCSTFYISFHAILYIIFYTLYFHIFIFCTFIFQMSGKSKIEDTCLTSWKTLLDANFKSNFFNVIFSGLYISYFHRCTLS